MIEEQMRFEQEKQKLKKREDKRMKEEQKKILGKGNARPKLSFSLGANSQHLEFYNFSSGVGSGGVVTTHHVCMIRNLT